MGRAPRVEVDNEHTTLIGGGRDPARIRERVAGLRKQLDLTTSQYDREQLEERIAKLTRGAALIRAGASTELEMKEKKSRVEDALHATRAAVEEGIGPGGGVALIRAGVVLQDMFVANLAQGSGIRIVQRAIEEPLRQIVLNAGIEPANVLAAVRRGEGSFGFNVTDSSYRDLFTMGVTDPTKVTRRALQNAASVAGLILTTDCVIADRPSPVSMQDAELGEPGG